MARESQRWRRVNWKHPHLQHLSAGGRHAAIDKYCLVCDSNHARRILLGDVKDADEAGHRDAGADLLHALARGRDRRILVIIYEPAG
jgi:hypothetical protein